MHVSSQVAHLVIEKSRFRNRNAEFEVCDAANVTNAKQLTLHSTQFTQQLSHSTKHYIDDAL